MSAETARTITFPSLPFELQNTEKEGQTKIVTHKDNSKQNFALGAIYAIYSVRRNKQYSLTIQPEGLEAETYKKTSSVKNNSKLC